MNVVMFHVLRTIITRKRTETSADRFDGLYTHNMYCMISNVLGLSALTEFVIPQKNMHDTVE